MSLHIQTIRPASPEEWDAIWRACDHATYFHSRQWAELWQTYSQGSIQPNPELLVFSDGREALLPISTSRMLKGLSQAYVLSPGSTFGGWISAQPLERSHTEALLAYLLRKGNLSWRWNPYEPSQPPLGAEDQTHVLTLSTDFDSVFRQWTKGHKSAAKKAQREGVCVKIADSPDDWGAYYEVYQDTLRRWGEKASTSYSWSFFKELCAKSSEDIKLWLAMFEGKVIAGALLFYAKSHVVYWHGAALDAHFQLRPVHLLMFETIKHACESGYQWFDFNPSGGNEGVKAFKKGFAAQELSCPIIRTETAFTRFAYKLAHLARRHA